MSKLIEIVKNIILNNEPNKLKYWKYIENNKIENNSLSKEYSNIKDFKNSKNCLVVGKFNDEIFHLDIRCLEYQKVLSGVLTLENKLFVLSYWIF